MLQCDLREYQCPQQFIQFKLALNKALLAKQSITFMFNNVQSTQDMQHFLEKHHHHFKINLQQGVLKVDPVSV